MKLVNTGNNDYEVDTNPEYFIIRSKSNLAGVKSKPLGYLLLDTRLKFDEGKIVFRGNIAEITEYLARIL